MYVVAASRKMVTFFCVITGLGAAFPVDIDASLSVGHLKDKIKEKINYSGPAYELQLFLAKTDGGQWLESGTEDVKKLKKGEKTAVIEALTHEDNELQGESGIKKVLMGMEQPSTDQIHVLVVVPKQRTSAPIVSIDGGVFDPCSDPFFSQFPKVDKVDGWLEFSSELALTERKKLYIRSSYKSIAEQASKTDPGRRKYAVITGSPGIGKSVFVYYVTWRLIKDQKRVLLFSSSGLFYFDGSTVVYCRTLPDKANLQFWSPDLWCLVDSQDPTNIAGLPYHRCSILLVSTPRRECISEFTKLAPTPDVFYMPLWTKEELSKIAPLYPNAQEKWVNRFECLGGVPRLVLENIKTDPQALVMTACASCSVDDCITLVSIYSELNTKTRIIQTLIHIHSQEPYQHYQVVFASELAKKVIARTKFLSDRKNMHHLLSACNANPVAQSLCGYIFESYSMDLLEKGGTFEYRELLSPAEMRQQRNKRKRSNPVSKINIPQSSQPRQVAERVEVRQTANQLYVPRTSNYTAIDAWMPKFGGFQMTVGKTHDIKDGAEADLAKLGRKGKRLFFLLPPPYYESFTKKKPLTMKQFAIRIEYPEQVND